MPDSNIMESLLLQLHYDSISVSFLKVGSTFQPQSNAGYVSYTDLLKFLSQSTLGVYMENIPQDVNTQYYYFKNSNKLYSRLQSLQHL